MDIARLCLTIDGTVQGVGFRPFVYHLAQELGLVGFVKNQVGNVLIEVEGRPEILETFVHKLKKDLPPPAAIGNLHSHLIDAVFDKSFDIQKSDASQGDDITIPPDIAPCAQCLAEMFDEKAKRYHYPLLSCTFCGPRMTLILDIPYDREKTTLHNFKLCSDCLDEYGDPYDRRFHAQVMACPECGPQLALIDHQKIDHLNQNQLLKELENKDLVKEFANDLRQGKIGALKSVGGYQLCCDATNEDGVRKLRQKKGRPDKALAVMVKDLAVAQQLCEISPAEERELLSVARPIVLLKIKSKSILNSDSNSDSNSSKKIAAGVAPGNPYLGLMLPSSPLHEYLFSYLGNLPVVMTSANHSEEPIIFDDAKAATDLGAWVDKQLLHDRPIVLGLDDSVVRFAEEVRIPLRRARGFVPEAVRMPFKMPEPILALGGQLKNTFCLGIKEKAILSQHLGDLDQIAAFENFKNSLQHFQHLFRVSPQVVVHDLHPDYRTTVYAQWLVKTRGVKTMAIQHHHAHIASCRAENGLVAPVIGVAWDGTGYGSDGAIWGGEFLIVDENGFKRQAHFQYLPMPGGERAIREPWRMALAYLNQAGLCEKFLFDRTRIAPEAVAFVKKFPLNFPLTSSAGRLFDGVAAILGICQQQVSFEGQAAMELEGLAMQSREEGILPYAVIDRGGESGSEEVLQIDHRPLVKEIVEALKRGKAPADLARMFHFTMAQILTDVCLILRKRTERTGVMINDVALSGGVFMNALLLHQARKLLLEKNFRVFCQQKVPPNDGGLSLGQLAVACSLMIKK